jgi:hypothetical protein
MMQAFAGYALAIVALPRNVQNFGATMSSSFDNHDLLITAIDHRAKVKYLFPEECPWQYQGGNQQAEKRQGRKRDFRG